VAIITLHSGIFVFTIFNTPQSIIVLTQQSTVQMDFCSQCALLCTNAKVCSKCRHCRYCSRECQIKAWNSGHKAFCKIASSVVVVPIGNDCKYQSFSTFSSQWAQTAHVAHKLFGVLEGVCKRQSLDDSENFQNLFRDSISASNCKWPSVRKGRNNNRIELITAIIDQLRTVLPLFFLHASRDMSNPQGVLLIESILPLEDLLRPPSDGTPSRPVVVHFFSVAELVSYFTEVCKDNPQWTPNQLMTSCNLGSLQSVDRIPVVCAFHHGLDGGNNQSQSFTTLGIAGVPVEQSDQIELVWSVLYEEAGGLRSAQMMEIDLLTGCTICFDINQAHFTK
jgi:hypothetical protein